ncbi:MAG: ABC transporter permease [Synergistaceae bacterium]|jgi:ribose transport system permease protein|nr:ABC transporter permease [Synergistaceae bacterium]
MANLSDERSAQGKHLAAAARKYGALLVLIVMIAANAAITPNFLKAGTLWNIIIQSCTIILTGMGMTMVISSGGIDISVGSMMAVGSMAAAKLLPLGLAPAILLSLALCLLMGAFTGFMIAKLRLQPMIMTLTMMMALRGGAQVMNNAMLLYINDARFAMIGNYKISGALPLQTFVVLVAVLAVYFIMEKMSLGRYIQSVGDNPHSSRLAGINTVRTIIIVYMFSAFFAGVTGIIETSRLSAADGNAIGRLAEMDAIAAVAVGGTSMLGGRAHVLGTIVGALIMQLITISVNMNNIPFELAQVIKAAVIIVAVFLQREKAR